MKYIIVKPVAQPKDISIYYPVFFTDYLTHSEMVPKGHEAVSGGFIEFSGLNNVQCSGKSDSLKLKSKPKKDSVFITKWLVYGDAALYLLSAEYDDPL